MIKNKQISFVPCKCLCKLDNIHHAWCQNPREGVFLVIIPCSLLTLNKSHPHPVSLPYVHLSDGPIELLLKHLLCQGGKHEEQHMRHFQQNNFSLSNFHFRSEFLHGALSENQPSSWSILLSKYMPLAPASASEQRWISNGSYPLHFSVIDVIQASHWALLRNFVCETLLPHSVWLTNIITWQSSWHWDFWNLVIRVDMKRPWHPPEIIKTVYNTGRFLFGSSCSSGLCHVQGLCSCPHYELDLTWLEHTNLLWKTQQYDVVCWCLRNRTVKMHILWNWKINVYQFIENAISHFYSTLKQERLSLSLAKSFISSFFFFCHPSFHATDSLHLSDTRFARRTFIKCWDKDSTVLLQGVWLAIWSMETKGKSFFM